MSGGLKQLSTRAWVINVVCVAALGRDIVLDARLGSFRNDHFPDLPPQRPPNQPATSDSEKKHLSEDAVHRIPVTLPTGPVNRPRV